MSLARDGCLCFPATDAGRRWARAARRAGLRLTADQQVMQANLRHGGTWFVGVDALPNDDTGTVEGVPLIGPWAAHLPLSRPLHRAQLSIVYPGYPARDPGQSDANHRFRLHRKAAHVDGLLPVGPDRRRYPGEFHAWVLGIHLNDCDAAPTVWWPGSHRVIGRALAAAIGDADPAQVDVTDAYAQARRAVFETCAPQPLIGPRGASFLLHRFTLHGTEPWSGPSRADGRMTAFFRPEFDDRMAWLGAE